MIQPIDRKRAAIHNRTGYCFGWLLLAFLIAACQPAAAAPQLPTPIPHPTTTPGKQLSGSLPLVDSNTDTLENPATAIALANQATPTPNTAACPSLSDNIVLAEASFNQQSDTTAITRFLSSGGSPRLLVEKLTDEWEAFDDEAYLRDDVDLTGEGIPEIVLGYIAPGAVGTLLILGCENGEYINRYQAIADGASPPRLLWLEDMNNDRQADVVFASRRCETEEFCELETQVITWDKRQGRFLNLIADTLRSIEAPRLVDMDNDVVSEIIVPLTSRGVAAVGPLRTGIHIYDWNGQVYTLSLIQLDPPRYRVQVVHEADRAFNRVNMDTAAQLYELALNNEALRFWFNDEPDTLNSYVLYRLLLTYTFQRDERLNEIIQQVGQAYPIGAETVVEDLPVYVEMTYTFWNALQVSNDLHNACLQVLDLVDRRPEALSLLNRYGSRSPTYTAIDLCPF